MALLHPGEKVALMADQPAGEAGGAPVGRSICARCGGRSLAGCVGLLVVAGVVLCGAAGTIHPAIDRLPPSGLRLFNTLEEAPSVEDDLSTSPVEDCLNTGYLKLKKILYNNMCGAGPDDGHDGMIIEVEIIPPPTPAPPPPSVSTEPVWEMHAGLPPDEGDDLDLDTHGITKLGDMIKACEDHKECVGFAWWPQVGRWHPKKKSTGFNAYTATYTQYKEGEDWEWHFIKSRGYSTLFGNMFSTNKDANQTNQTNGTHLGSAGLVTSTILALSITAIDGECVGGEIQGHKGFAINMAPDTQVSLDLRLIDYHANRTVLIPHNYVTWLDFVKTPDLRAVALKSTPEDAKTGRRLRSTSKGAVGAMNAQGFSTFHTFNESQVEHESHADDLGVTFRVPEAEPKAGHIQINNLTAAQKARAVELLYDEFTQTDFILDVQGGDATSYSFLFAFHASVDCNAELGGVVPWHHDAGAINASFWLRTVCCVSAFLVMAFCGYITPRFERPKTAENAADASHG